jgi:hypothetical protein
VAGAPLPVATVGRTIAEPVLMCPLGLHTLNDGTCQTQGAVVNHTCIGNGVSVTVSFARALHIIHLSCNDGLLHVRLHATPRAQHSAPATAQSVLERTISVRTPHDVACCAAASQHGGRRACRLACLLISMMRAALRARRMRRPAPRRAREGAAAGGVGVHAGLHVY